MLAAAASRKSVAYSAATASPNHPGLPPRNAGPPTIDRISRPHPPNPRSAISPTRSRCGRVEVCTASAATTAVATTSQPSRTSSVTTFTPPRK